MYWVFAFAYEEMFDMNPIGVCLRKKKKDMRYASKGVHMCLLA